jgi:N-acetylated-alpha-linked acidic dipeptidase
VYCAWDGEEPALLGSTEFAEDHANELQQKAVVYINSDANGRGFLFAGGSHALETFVTEVARDVNDPQTNVSVLERLKAAEIINAPSAKAKQDALQKKGIGLGALGSGSDYSSFLQHLGVPTLDLGFGGEDNGGEYHSIYDSYDMYRRFKDPSFEYGVTLSKTVGHAVLRMSDADVLPFDFRNLYKIINDYTTELINSTNDMRESTNIENQIITDRDYSLATDTALHMSPPKQKDEVPYLDFSALQNALSKLQKATDTLYAKWSKMSNANNTEAFNRSLYEAEQQLLLPNGLPRRSWYKHAIYAPGFYTGYGVKTMPGIREAIEQRKWKEAQEQINVDADAINKLTDYLNKISQ